MSVIIDKTKCTGCGKCKDVCPVNAINIEGEKALVNDSCIECGMCIGECGEQAISLSE